MDFVEYDVLFVQAIGSIQGRPALRRGRGDYHPGRFSVEDPLSAVKVASAFGDGIAGSTQELYGAFTGKVITLSSLLGRSEPGLELKDCVRLIKEFKLGFAKELGSLQCRPLLDAQAQKGREAPASDCAQITIRAISLLGGLMQTRQDLPPSLPLGGAQPSPGPKLAPGACPFGGCDC
ncbi:hypothetical protein DFAR_10026 [Desulfarculales bacterium]